MNKLKLIYKVTTSPIIKKLIEDGDELSAWQTIYGGSEDEDILRIIYVSDNELYTLSNGIKKEYWNNGQLCAEYHVNKNGKRDGLYRDWWENGQLWVECTYKNGKLDGLYRSWYENGQVSIECMYKNSKKDGLYRLWNLNGELDKEHNCKNGKVI